MSTSSSSSETPTSASSESSESPVDFCADGLRRLQLVPQFQKNFVINERSGFRLRIDVANPCEITDKIFRYYRYPPSQLEDNQILDSFTGVCSWPDLADFPEDAPLPDASPAVFRQNFIDIVVATETLAYEVWELVKEDVDRLIQTIDEGDELELGDAYWAGNALTT